MEDVRRETHLHGGNRTELLVDPIVELDIGETLDVSAAFPRPACGPCHGVFTDGLELRALPTGGCMRLAPKIEQ